VNSADLRVEMLAPSELIQDAGNPRQHTTRQIRQIARSIETFGFCVPILVDAGNRIVAGHGRALAAIGAGRSEVPIIRLGHLSDAQVRAFAIADNRLSEIATWDKRLLGEVFQGLAALDLDFSLEATGFSMAEIDLTIADMSVQIGDGPDPADVLEEEAPGLAPVPRPGDLWRLGPHKLLCANALDPASFNRLMDGRLAHAVISDPPYNVKIDGHASGNGTIHHREFAMAAGEMSNGEFADFPTAAMGHLASHSMSGSLHYLFMDWRHLGILLRAGEKIYDQLLNICVWTKHNPGMGSFYRSQHEFVGVFRNGCTASEQHSTWPIWSQSQQRLGVSRDQRFRS
jgi:ParB-like nuclease domain